MILTITKIYILYLSISHIQEIWEVTTSKCYLLWSLGGEVMYTHLILIFQFSIFVITKSIEERKEENKKRGR